jgi:methylthioribose-1-phosphate isomerase
MSNDNKFKSINWTGKSLILLDQRKIPFSREFLECKSLEMVIFAIKNMIVRGAPAIALSGIYGIALYLLEIKEKPDFLEFEERLKNLLESRPTAVNLKLALERYSSLISKEKFNNNSLENITSETIEFANLIFNEDLEVNRRIANNGTFLFPEDKKNISILTHCNTGALATAGIGTAIGVIRALKNKGYNLTVYASETRPYHQGSRLTAWELKEEEIECFIIGDSMSAWLMNDRKIDAVLVGADRITKNGDTANKIGTLSHAIIAKNFNIPFYVAASSTSFDFNLENGNQIHIEMRSEDELTQNSFLKDENGKNYIPQGVLSPLGAKALNPSFDVTPSKYISGIITEKGVISPVNINNIKSIIGTND